MRDEVINLWNKGYTRNEISHILKINYSSVKRIIFKNNLSDTRRMSNDEYLLNAKTAINKLYEKLGRVPTSREFNKIYYINSKYSYNDLLNLCNLQTNRNYMSEDEIVKSIVEYRNKNGLLPMSKDLKLSIGIAHNCKVFSKYGGYTKFLENHNLIHKNSILKQGYLTLCPTTGLDGWNYISKIEAIFANFLFSNKIEYYQQIKLGKFKGSNDLTIDFLICYKDKLYAVEVDGLGKIRKNVNNLAEKRKRSAIRLWNWILLPRDKIRWLMNSKRQLEYWEELVSLAEPWQNI